MWLPHLADGAWVRDVVTQYAERLGLTGEVQDVRLVDVRLSNPHRPESKLCRGWATYVVELRGATPVRLYLKGFADEAAWLRERASGPPGRCTDLPGLELLVYRFPQDPRLPSLPALVEPSLEPELLPSTVVDLLGGRPVDVRSTVGRYQPATSATLRLEGGRGGPAVFAKHLADDGIADIAALQEALWAVGWQEPSLRVAEPLAADPVRRVLWTRGVPGHPLTTAVTTEALPAAAAPGGALLAALHRSGVEPEETVRVDGLVHEMGKKAAKLAVAHPGIAPVVTGLAATAVGRLAKGVRERSCPLHGDFHLDQLVSSPDGPVLVDLDSMVRGAPELDLAEFLVELALRRLPITVADAVARALVSSYVAAGGFRGDAPALELCADAEFVNRCYRHLRRHTRGWQEELEAELSRHDEMQRLLRSALE